MALKMISRLLRSIIRLLLQLGLNRVKKFLAIICMLAWITGLLCIVHWMLLTSQTPREDSLVNEGESWSLDPSLALQLKSHKQSETSEKCISPSLPVFNKFISDNRPKLIPPDVCHKSRKPNWLQVSDSKVFIKSQFAGATCSAEQILRISDDKSEFASAQPIHNGSEVPSLGFRATCTSPDSAKSHTSVYYGIKRVSLGKSTQRQHAASAPGQQDNIIILGLDSVSRLESLRSLPVASGLIKSKLGGVTLLQYNILGDGTPAALLPILTGVKEEDMPESRRGFNDARYVDDGMRWLFSHLRERGYVTLYGEEGSGFGTFQLRFLGFKNQPADFYLRPVLQQQEPLQTDGICIGDEFASARMLNTARDLFTLYPHQAKFAFLFFSQLSHENKDLSLMDSELTEFINWFVREDLSRNTTLILMSDHGQRHGPLRNSMQGKLEESLPLMTISLSRQLMTHRTAALQMLLSNVNKLTTPVDIHRSLLSIAAVPELTSESDAIRSYSLIDQRVPENRTCSDAGIPTHWCSCLRLTKVSSPNTDELALRAARYAVDQMNKATQPVRHLCHQLRLANIDSAEINHASLGLARRIRRVSAKSIMAYNVNNKEVNESGYINIRFATAPNNGLYEATVQFSLFSLSNTEYVRLGLPSQASRINAYGNQANCIARHRPHLRKFCFCNSAL